MTYADPSDLLDDAIRSLMLQRAEISGRIDAAIVYLGHVRRELESDDLAAARRLAMSAARCEDDATGDRRACGPLVDALETEEP